MRKLITSVVGLLFVSIAFSQSYVGFLNENYSGIHAVINNPANIVDSRFRTDINLFGGSYFVGNDYGGIKFSDLLNGNKIEWSNIVGKKPLSSNNLSSNLDVLGPSFMFNIAPRHSIAISTRVRTFFNVDDINGKELSNIEDYINNGFDIEGKYSSKLGNFSSNVNAWAELGLTYAAVLVDEGEHFLKGGLTLKYLRSVVYARGGATNINLDYDGNTPNDITDNVLKTEGELYYEYSLSNKDKDFDDAIKKLNFNEGRGFAADLGFTYEWRPDIDEYAYVNNHGKKAYYNDVNKYKLRLGLSITDVGSIKHYEANQEVYNLNGDYIDKLKEDGAPENNVASILTYYFGTPRTVNDSFMSKMPTALHLNADWNFNNKFYLNFDTNFDMASKKASSIENTYSLTPRYETKWFSTYLPLSVREYSGFNAGVGFRVGPLYVGSGSIITNLLSRSSESIDFYAGLKIPIYQSRPKDMDGDKVFDKFDNCPTVAGPVENEGCPWGDKDKDGIKDNRDKCPDVAGPVENDGCPWGDGDNDGVKDNKDKCPTVMGAIGNNGCPWPDTDKDGFTDNVDGCPKVPGVAPYGCPEKKDEVIIITSEVEEKIGNYTKSIYFNTGRYTFRRGVIAKLDKIANIMKKYPDMKFSINGYTDSQGRDEINLLLSQRRARAVLDYLVYRGIASSRLFSYGFGESNPIATNATKRGRALNRRVEIKAIK